MLFSYPRMDFDLEYDFELMDPSLYGDSPGEETLADLVNAPTEAGLASLESLLSTGPAWSGKACPVPGCGADNLANPMSKWRHWSQTHESKHWRYQCPKPGCSTQTRRPRAMKDHLRKHHQVPPGDGSKMIYLSDAPVTNPNYVDPGPCQSPPGYQDWNARMTQQVQPLATLGANDKECLEKTFRKPRTNPNSRDVSSQTLEAPLGTKQRDRAWASLINQWRACVGRREGTIAKLRRKIQQIHNNTLLRVMRLRREKKQLRLRLASTERSLRRTLRSWREAKKRSLSK